MRSLSVIGSQLKTEAVREQVVAHVQVSLHVVHVDVAVPRMATSVVLDVGARTLPVPQLHKVCKVYTQQQEFDDVQEEELLKNDSPRREYGEACVSVEEDALSADDYCVENSDT